MYSENSSQKSRSSFVSYLLLFFLFKNTVSVILFFLFSIQMLFSEMCDFRRPKNVHTHPSNTCRFDVSLKLSGNQPQSEKK
ncbi:hypothetical protein L5515_011515 [Caenorhabditis briggsae]|uniref:Uncharacterized protein n=1 Tax=Caenorhabditis briggsae TaxID=6238 RepID=A0AAE9EU52_CAEBR|nr:hypothetical protein L5515_011515 [Caenorhabditis briggsae]